MGFGMGLLVGAGVAMIASWLGFIYQRNLTRQAYYDRTLGQWTVLCAYLLEQHCKESDEEGKKISKALVSIIFLYVELGRLDPMLVEDVFNRCTKMGYDITFLLNAEVGKVWDRLPQAP